MSETDTVHILSTIKFSRDIQNRLESISPRVKLHLHPARQLADIPSKAWKSAEVLYTTNILPPSGSETQIKWIQSHYAGVDALLNHPFLEDHPEIAITSTRGIHATNIAEYVLSMILMLGHHFPAMLLDQRVKEWAEDRHVRYLPKELRRSTVGILGYGSIGREVARLCKAFGANVLATKHDLKNLQHDGYLVEGTGDPEGEMFDRLYPTEATGYMVKECDFVVITLPFTPDTQNLVNEKILKTMKPTAYLINVGRGGIVDETALVEALRQGEIAGAAMDVFETEPLPANHPLWTAPNFILTPHLSGNTSDYNEKAAAVFEENLRRYLEGRSLRNLVSRALGY